jgi:hypothetical protein
MSSHFSITDLDGFFNACFDGFVFSPQGSVLIPVSAVGVLHADGGGKLRNQRTLNFGGQIYDGQIAEGGYALNSSGIGQAWLIVADGGVKFSYETFKFVLDEERREIQFVSIAATIRNRDTGTDDPTNVIVRGLGQRTSPILMPWNFPLQNPQTQ